MFTTRYPVDRETVDQRAVRRARTKDARRKARLVARKRRRYTSQEASAPVRARRCARRVLRQPFVITGFGGGGDNVREYPVVVITAPGLGSFLWDPYNGLTGEAHPGTTYSLRHHRDIAVYLAERERSEI